MVGQIEDLETEHQRVAGEGAQPGQFFNVTEVVHFGDCTGLRVANTGAGDERNRFVASLGIVNADRACIQQCQLLVIPKIPVVLFFTVYGNACDAGAKQQGVGCLGRVADGEVKGFIAQIQLLDLYIHQRTGVALGDRGDDC